MAKYAVVTGGITPGVLYKVIGAQSVVYNGGTYATGSTFRGVAGVSAFTYSGSGTQEVNEVWELKGGGIEYIQNGADIIDNYYTFDQQTVLKGFAVEYVQSGADIEVR